MPGDGHHAHAHAHAHAHGGCRAANPQSGSSSPVATVPNAATVVMPGLWKKLQAPRDVGCGACGARRTPQRALAACKACLAVVYCDRRCQAQHWERAHRHECGPLAAQSLEALVARITSSVRAKRRHRAAVGGVVGLAVEDRDPAALLDAWMDEAGQQAAAGCTTTSAPSSSPSWVDELRTLCLLANTCLLHNPAGAPHATAAAYLKALAIRGQLCLRPNTPKEKRRLAARNLAHARSMLGLALQRLAPVWQARVACVHARLLCALGGAAEREEALVVLRAAAAGMGEGNGGAARALVLLELTQAGYYDRLGGSGASTAAAAQEAEAACRAVLGELLVLVVDGGEKEDDGRRAALLATGAFRLADLLLVRATTVEQATEALALCRLSLRHAAGRAQFAALEAYMAHALALVGAGGRAEARAEVEGERRRRRRLLAVGGADVKSASSSLLSLGGMDAWRLPLVSAAGGAAAAAAAAAASVAASAGGVINCGAEFKGVGAPGTEHAPTTTLLGILTNHQQQPLQPLSLPLPTPAIVEEEKSEQPPKAPLPAIPTTEEEQEQDSMEVDRHADDDTMTSPSSSCYVPHSSVVAHARSTSDAPVGQPAAKRTRLSYYPFFQGGVAGHNKPRVTLPCWVGAK